MLAGTSLADDLAAGADMPADEDLVHSILNMLPSGLSMEMKAKAHAEKTSEDLREWIRLQAEFHRQEGHAGRGAHVVERGLEPNAHPSEEPELEDDAILELDPEVLAFMIAAGVNAFLQIPRGNRWLEEAYERHGGGPTCRSETFREWHPWGGSRWRAGSWLGKEGLVCKLW